MPSVIGLVESRTLRGNIADMLAMKTSPLQGLFRLDPKFFWQRLPIDRNSDTAMNHLDMVAGWNKRTLFIPLGWQFFSFPG